MKKILFIKPVSRVSVFHSTKIFDVPPLSLLLLASFTPENYDVKIIDEKMDPLDYDEAADMVAITCMTPTATRAYEIAGEFRKRGVTVIMGGIHVSLLPDEAEQCADSIIMGEGEYIWKDVLKDWENNKLKKRYKAELQEIQEPPRIRHELIDQKKYFLETVTTSRGCPYNCDFCTVTKFNGGKYRFRPMDAVIDEVAGLKSNYFCFTDDNIVGTGRRCRDRSLELFDRMKEVGKKWFSQVSINIVEDDELLRKAADAGARLFFIGLESLSPETLKAMKKNINLKTQIKNYKTAIKKMQDHGIAVIGGFIFGYDTDTVDVFDRTTDFILESGMDSAQMLNLTPFPGTKVYDTLLKEGRILATDYPKDWARYHLFDVVFRPKKMSVDDLITGQRRAYKTISALKHSLPKMLSTYKTTRTVTPSVGSFYWKYAFHKCVMKDYRNR